jgi:hypothetical protein
MPPANLIERRKSIRQKRARLQIDEALADIDERKSRSGRLYRNGAIVEKHAALANLSPALLDAALAEQDAAAKEPKTLQRWEKAADEKASREAAEKAQPVEIFIITFSGPVSPEVLKALKEKGFRLNRLRAEWEGKTNRATAEALAGSYGTAVPYRAPAEVPLAAE